MAGSGGDWRRRGDDVETGRNGGRLSGQLAEQSRRHSNAMISHGGMEGAVVTNMKQSESKT
jgi:hypothetical protein